jgi:hypothetical protein
MPSEPFCRYHHAMDLLINSVKVVVASVLVLLFFQLRAQAEEFRAIVTGVYDGGQTLQVTAEDPFGRMQNNVRVYVAPDVTLAGIRSLQEITTGQRLVVEGAESGPHYWQAARISTPVAETKRTT